MNLSKDIEEVKSLLNKEREEYKQIKDLTIKLMNYKFYEGGTDRHLIIKELKTKLGIK